MQFDLWDVGTNQYLGHYEDEADALVLVRTLMECFGPDYADALELGGVTAEGEALEPLAGAALIARTDEVLSRRQDDQGEGGIASGANGAPHGATTYTASMATANGIRRRVVKERSRKHEKP